MDDEGRRQGRSRALALAFKTCPLWSHSWRLCSNCAPLGMRGRRWANFFMAPTPYGPTIAPLEIGRAHTGGTISLPWLRRVRPPALVLGGVFAHLWLSSHLPWARGFVCRHPRYLLCPMGRGSHPSPALRQALVRWAANQAKRRCRGRLRRWPWVIGLLATHRVVVAMGPLRWRGSGLKACGLGVDALAEWPCERSFELAGGWWFATAFN